VATPPVVQGKDAPWGCLLCRLIITLARLDQARPEGEGEGGEGGNKNKATSLLQRLVEDDEDKERCAAMLMQVRGAGLVGVVVCRHADDDDDHDDDDEDDDDEEEEEEEDYDDDQAG
jgi:hypothetical protein